MTLTISSAPVNNWNLHPGQIQIEVNSLPVTAHYISDLHIILYGIDITCAMEVITID
jgi:hypothetical protein